MKEEKHLEIIKEVEETIQGALESGKILSHQRRLISMLSLGAQQFVEVYLHRLKVIKSGIQVKHEWFGMGERNLSIKLSAVLTMKIGDIPHLGDIIELARRIEAERNDILYGSPLVNEVVLREKIDAFLEIKRMVEEYG